MSITRRITAAMAAACLLSFAGATDVEVKSFSCDSDSSFTVSSFALECSDTACSLGDEVTMTGDVTLVGLEDFSAGTFKVDMSKLGMTTTLVENEIYDVCVDGLTSQNDESSCPADGDYTLFYPYTLPEFGGSWWMTGWSFNVHFTLSKTDSETGAVTQVGKCTATLGASVSSSVSNASSGGDSDGSESDGGKKMQSFVPSAGAVFSWVILGLLSMCVCCSFMCMRRNRGSDDPKTFKLMEESDKQEADKKLDMIEQQRSLD
eukprot:CAMPEP_0198295604 /NCGR_PEP_ID=MMETSP1449-20131203/28596_1 /TAXON_ID=420275 /ORGANISM="Attheya septentrionalis, Strain CCMP2084" /LENGTH=261 /DNA_ID=CAMNT_0043995963 /DNA_START=28 /DNA_END=813 /DNA_ORIENTATION=-